MSKVQWLGDPVSDCKENQSNRDKCAGFAVTISAATGSTPAMQFYRDACLQYLCTTGNMPSSASELPPFPKVYEPYPWGVYDAGTEILQKELNKKLKADGLCPITEDGKVGAGTCGAAKKYGVPLPSCAGKSATAPAPCGVTPKPEPVPPPVSPATATKSAIPWAPILVGGAVLAVVGYFVFAKGAQPLVRTVGSNPARGPSRMAKPDKYGRHPKYKHLVMFEIESHYGSYILTAVGHEGDALISEDDARQMFGKDFDHEFGYLTDEYLQLLEKR